ncbi:hypothetical protein UFOVP1344_24 [uncultured Caudovirales phage]|uniref:Uncharacterized protein n=1 Tax=uncultured Caudovirales phage TaxID=2100421 RepID=A0A6J5RSA4_9CAUD|nr:hypothetical protein UFOVP1005_24 [uncultured Caudovirales phage]CAB4200041.1 hypothetical protein UFOVP1344_24 [uncultured Caudovirales phage]CAB4218203.1 hypothetical protein UFOVP1602_16 [uncultured Caudovirales phage]
MSHRLADVRFIYDGGSVGILIPKTEGAQTWLHDNVLLEEAVRFGEGIAVEMRYADDLLNALSNDGFVVELS